MSTDNTLVARTILDQLGGGRFQVMTGANSFVASPDGISFRIPKGKNAHSGRAVNVVRVTLDPSDTYTIEVSYLRAGVLRSVETVSDVYCDHLRPVFEQLTGLYTRL